MFQIAEELQNLCVKPYTENTEMEPCARSGKCFWMREVREDWSLTSRNDLQSTSFSRVFCQTCGQVISDWKEGHSIIDRRLTKQQAKRFRRTAHKWKYGNPSCKSFAIINKLKGGSNIKAFV